MPFILLLLYVISYADSNYIEGTIREIYALEYEARVSQLVVWDVGEDADGDSGFATRCEIGQDLITSTLTQTGYEVVIGFIQGVVWGVF